MKTQKGITLISLIITVIVMLILSAVTISMVIGENGIVQKAGEATIEQEAQAGKEKLAMDLMEYQTIGYTKGITLEEFLLTKERDYIKNDDGTIEVTEGNYIYTVAQAPTLEITNWRSLAADPVPAVLEGEGEVADPYVINSIEDYVAFVMDTRDGETYEGQYIELGRNLDFKDKLSYADPTTKIFGDINENGVEEDLYTELNDETARGLRNIFEFAGTLDGKNRVIKNFFMQDKLTSSDGEIALIENNKGTIKNLTVTGKIIAELEEDANHIRVGAFIASNDGGSIFNSRTGIDVTVTGTLNQTTTGITTYIGSFIGKNDDAGASSIHECINYGKIYVDINIKADTEFEGMEEAYNSLQVGGIVGKNKNLIVNAINEGEIYVKRTFNSTVGVGDSGVKVGGIAGEIEYDDSTVGNYASIVNAVSTGKITAISETSEVVVGGIVGQLSDDTSDQSGIANNLVKIQNAFAATGINVQATADQTVEVGGISGNAEGNVENCYSLDDITASEEINKRYFGALIGNYRDTSTISNCFYRKGTYLGAQGEDKEGITVLDSLTQSEALLYLNQNVDINNADSAKIADWLKFVEMNDTVRFEE